MLEEIGAYGGGWSKSEGDDFLLREGFDLLAAFRAIKSDEARSAIIVMIAAVVEAERQAVERQTPSSAYKTP